MFRKIFKLAASSLLLCTALTASSSNLNYQLAVSNSHEKVYISSDQIVCSDRGLFLLLEIEEGSLAKILVPQINWDENGLFVLAEHIPLPQAAWCRLGHPACNKCYRCDVPGCPSYGCKCRH